MKKKVNLKYFIFNILVGIIIVFVIPFIILQYKLIDQTTTFNTLYFLIIVPLYSFIACLFPMKKYIFRWFMPLLVFAVYALFSYFYFDTTILLYGAIYVVIGYMGGLLWLIDYKRLLSH